jgi:hypothetical protein
VEKGLEKPVRSRNNQLTNMNTINIYTKLKNIQSKGTEIVKDNLNKFQGYKYFTKYQALTFLKPLLAEQGLSLHFEDLSKDYKV